MEEKKYTGYGYHGGGRKPKGEAAKNTTISIAGTKAEIENIRQRAKLDGKTVSRYVIDFLGV